MIPLAEIDIDNLTSNEMSDVKEMGDKYYLVKKDNIYGVYNKYYGFTRSIDKI